MFDQRANLVDVGRVHITDEAPDSVLAKRRFQEHGAIAGKLPPLHVLQPEDTPALKIADLAQLV